MTTSDSAAAARADFAMGVRLAIEFGRRTPIIGEAALFSGHVTEAQLTECIEAQARERAQGGEARRIGDILVTRGYMAREAVEVLAETLVQLRLAADGLGPR